MQLRYVRNPHSPQHVHHQISIRSDQIRWECIRDLVECGVDVKGEAGGKALAFAVQEGHLECMKELVKCDVDVKGEDGKWALRTIAKKGYYECMAELVLRGANVCDTAPFSDEESCVTGRTHRRHGPRRSFQLHKGSIMEYTSDPLGRPRLEHRLPMMEREVERSEKSTYMVHDVVKAAVLPIKMMLL